MANATCTCGNTAQCRTCVDAIRACLKDEAQPPAQRNGVGAVAVPRQRTR